MFTIDAQRKHQSGKEGGLAPIFQESVAGMRLIVLKMCKFGNVQMCKWGAKRFRSFGFSDFRVLGHKGHEVRTKDSMEIFAHFAPFASLRETKNELTKY